MTNEVVSCCHLWEPFTNKSKQSTQIRITLIRIFSKQIVLIKIIYHVLTWQVIWFVSASFIIVTIFMIFTKYY
jgi:hypothetical protein